MVSKRDPRSLLHPPTDQKLWYLATMAESILDDWTTKMTEALTRVHTSSHTPLDSSTVPIGIKLDGSNYALWSQVIEMYISGKDKLGYIIGDFPQPLEIDPSFRKWRTENAIVWDSVATTYFDGTDTSQIYDLRHRVTRMRQTGVSIEKYYTNLQGLWCEIDFLRPNLMKCAIDIQKYNSIVQEERVYVFLDGLDDRLDNIRSDVLQLQLFPTVE
ncbi:hypothetical protein F2P56_025190 [Juglans regia]|uniref:Retrotransposon Copia-like N-terminal domain-containing protein n=2 Tax=Juglans regia TaxID=51240 RepID=A0A833UJC6_JUGRE|nr:uncharacterized protein LOC109002907 [Juglans regia]KAF5455638.1 hypothetical protein F2P56_025190 [Juglans regia]